MNIRQTVKIFTILYIYFNSDPICEKSVGFVL